MGIDKVGIDKVGIDEVGRYPPVSGYVTLITVNNPRVHLIKYFMFRRAAVS